MLYNTVTLKQIIGLSVKIKTVGLVEEHMRENLCGLRIEKEFIDTTPKKNNP